MSEVMLEKPTILVVDDTPDNISLISGLLIDTYRIKVATNGEKALRIAAAEPRPDLILLDIMMPGMDGYEVIRRLKADAVTGQIPVIFLTAMTDVASETRGFDLGAVDYITKPISPPVLMARVRTHLTLKFASDFLHDRNDFLEKEVVRRSREILAVQDVTILAMASLAETRDNETGNHIMRTQHYVRTMAVKLSENSRYAATLTRETVDLISKSATLHDIGKVGIPDAILLKPGKLTPEEFEIMKRHAVFGRDAIVTAESKLGVPNSFLRHAREIAHAHHERWDGKGYPDGLTGEDIPLAARLMAVADVYDALISRRVYKPAFPHAKAVEIMREGRGSHFDPVVLDLLLDYQDRFQLIARKYADEPEPEV